MCVKEGWGGCYWGFGFRGFDRGHDEKVRGKFVSGCVVGEGGGLVPPLPAMSSIAPNQHPNAVYSDVFKYPSDTADQKG